MVIITKGGGGAKGGDPSLENRLVVVDNSPSWFLVSTGRFFLFFFWCRIFCSLFFYMDAFFGSFSGRDGGCRLLGCFGRIVFGVVFFGWGWCVLDLFKRMLKCNVIIMDVLNV